MSKTPPASWDIFCSVIDNFGDIGVTWRLARQLATEHQQWVRLWIDDLHAFNRLFPAASTQESLQTQQGVAIHLWRADWQPVEPADVVVEAFACQLPEAYIKAMAERTNPSLWLNLEYLSAEDWVGGCHGLPSLQPKGLHKFFFFPGFTAQTGGLLREEGLLQRRICFQNDAETKRQFLQQLGVDPKPGARLISLFAYENANLSNWLDTLASATTATQLLVPEGKILQDLQRWLGVDRLNIGDYYQRHSLSIQILPFVSQDDYDRLLWSCDFNAVRGEDSFIRAQWAGRPFLWHIYPQADNIHLDKLDAFFALYCENLSAPARNALQQLWQVWNSDGDMGSCWAKVLEHWPDLFSQAENWCQQQTKQTNLATALVQFYLNWLSCTP